MGGIAWGARGLPLRAHVTGQSNERRAP
eukprot:COSAG01_NODE_9626_length_2385_cov_1.969816_5_plen_27_part_01